MIFFLFEAHYLLLSQVSVNDVNCDDILYRFMHLSSLYIQHASIFQSTSSNVGDAHRIYVAHLFSHMWTAGFSRGCRTSNQLTKYRGREKVRPPSGKPDRRRWVK